jgi:Holliday junction resolvase RusA-like endonuclease
MIHFTIDGAAVPAGRPRFSTLGGHVRAVDPQKSRDYKQYVKMVASQHKPAEPIAGPVFLEVTVFRPMPKSFSKKKRWFAEQGHIWPTTKPDCSNFIKLLEDACNQIIWKDDSQIVRLIVEKRYSENPRVEITVAEL